MKNIEAVSEELDSNSITVRFLPGPVGLQLEEDGQYGSRVVRFVDGGPWQPGPARASGKIQPGDWITRVRVLPSTITNSDISCASQQEIATTYSEMLRFLQKTHLTRIVTIRSFAQSFIVMMADGGEEQSVGAPLSNHPSKGVEMIAKNEQANHSGQPFVDSSEVSAGVGKIVSFSSGSENNPIIPKEDESNKWHATDDHSNSNSDRKKYILSSQMEEDEKDSSNNAWTHLPLHYQVAMLDTTIRQNVPRSNNPPWSIVLPKTIQTNKRTCRDMHHERQRQQRPFIMEKNANDTTSISGYSYQLEPLSPFPFLLLPPKPSTPISTVFLCDFPVDVPFQGMISLPSDLFYQSDRSFEASSSTLSSFRATLLPTPSHFHPELEDRIFLQGSSPLLQSNILLTLHDAKKNDCFMQTKIPNHIFRSLGPIDDFSMPDFDARIELPLRLNHDDKLRQNIRNRTIFGKLPVTKQIPLDEDEKEASLWAKQICDIRIRSPNQDFTTDVSRQKSAVVLQDRVEACGSTGGPSRVDEGGTSNYKDDGTNLFPRRLLQKEIDATEKLAIDFGSNVKGQRMTEKEELTEIQSSQTGSDPDALLHKAKAKHQLSIAQLREQKQLGKKTKTKEESQTFPAALSADEIPVSGGLSQSGSSGKHKGIFAAVHPNDRSKVNSISTVGPSEMDYTMLESHDESSTVATSSSVSTPATSSTTKTSEQPKSRTITPQWMDFSQFSQEQVVIFEPGPLGMQLEQSFSSDDFYPAKIVRFVDGGPKDPGQARQSGLLRPGDFVVRVEAEGIVGTTYNTILHLLQKSWTNRKLTFRSAWDPSSFGIAPSTSSPSRGLDEAESSTTTGPNQTPTSPRSSHPRPRQSKYRNGSPLPYDWTPLPFDWIHTRPPQPQTLEEHEAYQQTYRQEASRLVQEREQQRRQARERQLVKRAGRTWNFEDMMLDAVALTAESVTGCLRKQSHDGEHDSDDEEYYEEDDDDKHDGHRKTE